MSTREGNWGVHDLKANGARAAQKKSLKILACILRWVHVIVKDRSKNISGINHLFKVDLYVMSANGWIL
jgi:hypothetical protein